MADVCARLFARRNRPDSRMVFFISDGVDDRPRVPVDFRRLERKLAFNLIGCVEKQPIPRKTWSVGTYTRQLALTERV